MLVTRTCKHDRKPGKRSSIIRAVVGVVCGWKQEVFIKRIVMPNRCFSIVSLYCYSFIFVLQLLFAIPPFCGIKINIRTHSEQIVVLAFSTLVSNTNHSKIYAISSRCLYLICTTKHFYWIIFHPVSTSPSTLLIRQKSRHLA